VIQKSGLICLKAAQSKAVLLIN